jgi:hypothetical protein
LIQLVKLKKFGTLGRWITKTETLVFELKNPINFEGVNYNFPMKCCLIILAGLCFIQVLPIWMTTGLAKECDDLFYFSPSYKLHLKCQKQSSRQNHTLTIAIPPHCKTHGAESHISSFPCNDFDL